MNPMNRRAAHAGETRGLFKAQMNYYNEFDPKAAAWLRELIAMGLIPAGDVDERSIIDVKPDDLLGYTQCHFFAGIGGWSRALHLADWPDTLPIWTGSCPCQPFSCAGAGKGTDDHRHLWPVFFKLIKAVRPVIVIGEQVASKAALVWFDGVCADLEGADYASGAVDLCAAGVNSPNIRQRLYWMAYSQSIDRRGELTEIRTRGGRSRFAGGGGMGDSSGDRSTSRLSGQEQGKEGLSGEPDDASHKSGNSFWAQYKLIPCRDGKFRRIEPGVPPLIGKFESRPTAVADGVSSGVVRGSDCGVPEDKGDAAEVKEIAGWPTPQVCTGPNNGKNRGKDHGGARPRNTPQNVVDLITGWPTPNTMDHIDRDGLRPSRVATGRTGGYIGEVVGWPTPRAEDSESTGAHRGAPDTMTSAARLAPSEIKPIHWANATGEGRVMRLKGYGNAINPVLASEFVHAVSQIIQITCVAKESAE